MNPNDDTLIAISGGRCPECDATFPKSGHPELREEVREEWRRRGLGQWIQESWPRQYPAWMVRQGFRCPFCNAPNLLVELAL